jgi:hypothetical protein
VRELLSLDGDVIRVVSVEASTISSIPVGDEACSGTGVTKLSPRRLFLGVVTVVNGEGCSESSAVVELELI